MYVVARLVLGLYPSCSVGEGTSSLRCYAKAPAKVILFGEHWVVHGGRAIASAIGIYSRVIAEPLHEGIVVESRNLGVVEDISKGCRIFCNLKKAFEYIAGGERVLWPASIVIDSKVPVGAGLGSSAAVAVSASAAYACVGGLSVSPDFISRAAYESEKVVHGTPSGVDNTVAAFGGFILYRRGDGFRPIHAGRLDDVVILVIDTGVSRSTASAVEFFAGRLRRLGSIGEEMLELAENIIDEALKAISSGDAVRLGELMDVAHGLLNAMGVSHVSLEKAVHVARANGALGAKLTGAGMGGSAIALVESSRAEDVASSLQELGFRVYNGALGAAGLSVACDV